MNIITINYYLRCIETFMKEGKFISAYQELKFVIEQLEDSIQRGDGK